MAYSGIGLPGRILGKTPSGGCEGYNNDCQAQAVIVVQGETDSFGFEEIHWCDGCHKLATQPSEEEEVFWCDWCKKKTQGAPVVTRDWGEGSTGPVYYVCRPCDTANTEDMENY